MVKLYGQISVGSEVEIPRGRICLMLRAAVMYSSNRKETSMHAQYSLRLRNREDD
jgi:hypothetical protein